VFEITAAKVISSEFNAQGHLVRTRTQLLGRGQRVHALAGLQAPDLSVAKKRSLAVTADMRPRQCLATPTRSQLAMAFTQRRWVR